MRFRVSWWETTPHFPSLSQIGETKRELRHREVSADGYTVEHCGAVSFWTGDSTAIFLTIRHWDQIELVNE